MMDTIVVNGTEIPPQAIAAEMQYHPAPTREQAWTEAAVALVIRQLLLQEAARHGIVLDADTDEEADREEAVIQELLAREVATPDADEATCRRYWSANPAKFTTPDVYEAAHILFPASPDDPPSYEAAKRAATETLALLQQDPGRFAALARERSACPSAAAEGRLGQLSRGDLVPEIETFVVALQEGQICPVPIATRYGYHVLRVDRFVAGSVLPFEAAAPRVERLLASQSWQRGVSQYLRVLAGRARIEGLVIDAALTPLVQ
ncbi:peptidylprolyl isomerase [Telmatospirillum sp.]|uniref:peptidylprolyl isomerase n=1 Tax=Telmatospirillum sp. TaxID=2079197 RepID=UPI00283EDFAC|nr:peptidylprolyl isomerase [Telmatospirillum sp.]MDR3435113.1 peptidylprolyl isomerase [Telmatospirillum sp.]